MALAQSERFFDIPNEIRNEIYFLIAYHNDTGGIISPLGEKHQPEISIGLLDNRRYPIKNQDSYYPMKFPALAPESLERQRFNETTNVTSKHFCTPNCLRPPHGASKTCRRMREEVLAVFYSVNVFHLEMSNFEVTDIEGLPIRKWSPVQWWRAIGDTNLRRITSFNMVCHPSTREVKNDVNMLLNYGWVGGNATTSVKRIDSLALEKALRAELGRPNHNKPPNRHPSDMTRIEMYRLQKWLQNFDFEVAIQQDVRDIRESGLHVRALERILAALEPWDVEYLRDHISLDDDELVVGNVKEGRGELALKWDFLS